MALQIVAVYCPKCTRVFRTLASVMEVTPAGACPRCHVPMRIGEPEPVSALRRPPRVHRSHKDQ